jgi:hypothetical protein
MSAVKAVMEARTAGIQVGVEGDYLLMDADRRRMSPGHQTGPPSRGKWRRISNNIEWTGWGHYSTPIRGQTACRSTRQVRLALVYVDPVKPPAAGNVGNGNFQQKYAEDLFPRHKSKVQK